MILLILGLLMCTHYVAYSYGEGTTERDKRKSYQQLQNALPKAYRQPSKRRK